MQDKAKKVNEILKQAQDIGTGLFTSRKGEALATRPMQLVHVDDEKCLWFYTRIDSDLTEEIENQPEVSVGFANPEDNLYVAVSGSASTVIDREKRAELWSPLLRSWFPEGVDDPQCILVKVAPDIVESWDGPAWRIIQLTEQIMAIAMGKSAEPAQHVAVSTH